MDRSAPFPNPWLHTLILTHLKRIICVAKDWVCPLEPRKVSVCLLLLWRKATGFYKLTLHPLCRLQQSFQEVSDTHHHTILEHYTWFLFPFDSLALLLRDFQRLVKRSRNNRQLYPGPNFNETTSFFPSTQDDADCRFVHIAFTILKYHSSTLTLARTFIKRMLDFCQNPFLQLLRRSCDFFAFKFTYMIYYSIETFPQLCFRKIPGVFLE